MRHHTMEPAAHMGISAQSRAPTRATLLRAAAGPSRPAGGAGRALASAPTTQVNATAVSAPAYSGVGTATIPSEYAAAPVIDKRELGLEEAVASSSVAAPDATMSEAVLEPDPLALAEADKPGVADNVNFEQHWSVARWRAYAWPPPGANLNTLEGLQIVAREAARHAAAANMAGDARSAAYWAYHVLRTTFFSVQGVAGVAAQAASSGTLRRGEATFFAGTTSLGRIINSMGLVLPAEAMGAYKQDLELVQAGAFKLPWDMTTPGHRQFNPVFIASQFRRFLAESGKILGARAKGESEAYKVPFSESNLYPKYYQNNFHFQTDGWFSSKSAKVYESSTETLFLGRQDAMQRSTLVPIARAHPSSNGAGLAMLEVGAGTGRFATYVRDNYPQAQVTVSDLSPFYLQEARDTMAHWQEQRGQAAPTARFVQAAAEALPLPSDSFDVVYSVYMFHEMPDTARHAALAEMARVLKPGGTLVVTDSSQLGDRPKQDATMVNFKNLNEPHYPSFIQFDFGAAFKRLGLAPGLKVLQSATKSLSATKPLRDSN